MAAESVTCQWSKEDIPDSDSLFFRAHRKYYKDGELIPAVFRDHERGMSVDWSKYSTPQETLTRAKKPSDNSVLSLPVEGVRNISLIVEHNPIDADRASTLEIDPNRSHTEIIGKKTEEVRIKLKRIYTEIIPLNRAL